MKSIDQDGFESKLRHTFFDHGDYDENSYVLRILLAVPCFRGPSYSNATKKHRTCPGLKEGAESPQPTNKNPGGNVQIDASVKVY